MFCTSVLGSGLERKFKFLKIGIHKRELREALSLSQATCLALASQVSCRNMFKFGNVF